jgi:hypothetical protein
MVTTGIQAWDPLREVHQSVKPQTPIAQLSPTPNFGCFSSVDPLSIRVAWAIFGLIE